MRILLVLILALLLGSCGNTRKVKQIDAQVIFEESSSGWFEGGDARWSFLEGELLGEIDSGSGFVMTRTAYDNFDLELEFYPDSTINSGIFVRCINTDISATDCFEINIWDLHPNQDFRTGSIVTRSQPLEKINTIGQWNTYRIRCTGDSVQAWINDTRTAAIRDAQLTGGYIALQAAGNGAIRFRNVVVRKLDEE